MSCDCALLTRLGEPVVTARLLVVAPHPDDETIGAGALLLRSTDAHVIVVTDGAPNDPTLWPPSVTAATREEYVSIRRDELRLALHEAGVGVDRLHLLDVADGEATDHIVSIVRRIAELLERIEPEVVVAPAYEGGHVDHDATALAVRAAISMTGRGHHHEMALYHAAGAAIAVHEFVGGDTPGREWPLAERLAARKAAMLARYQSQQHYRAYFDTRVERYRCAPVYDFRRSPTPDQPLLYERADPTAGEQWRARAAEALAALPSLGEPAHAGPALTARNSDEAPADAPLVSVIVRTVGRDTLADALDSIRCQTYSNLEVVLVDVGGTCVAPVWEPRPGLALRTCAATGFDRPRAANAGLDCATGRYLAFLDDDDWYHPEHIVSLVTGLSAAGDARVAYAGVEVVESIDDAPPRRRGTYDAPFDPIRLLYENYIPLNALLVDGTLRDEGVRFDEGLHIYEDWDFLIGLSRRSRFVKVPGIGAVYRWPPGSVVNDPRHTGVAQERIYAKWRRTISAEEHIAIMRRAVAQTELNDEHRRRLSELQAHLRAQDDELATLRPHVRAQEQHLDELRDHLRGQRHELDRLQAILAAQEARLSEQHGELVASIQEGAAAKDAEMTALRAQLTAQAADLQRVNEQLATTAHRLSQIHASHSWRFTAPLRNLRANWKRWRIASGARSDTGS